MDEARCIIYAVQPTSKGHYGANNFVPCREVVPNNTLNYQHGVEVVPISEGPLLYCLQVVAQLVKGVKWKGCVFVGQTFDGATPLRCFCPNVDAWSEYMAFYTAGWGPLANDTSK